MKPQTGLEKRLAQIGAEKAPTGPGYAELRDMIRPLAQDKIQKEVEDISAPASRGRARAIVSELVEEKGPHINKPMQLGLVEELLDDLLGHGPLEPYMHDPDITEIKVLRWDHVRTEKFGVEKRMKASFRNEAHCRDVLDRLLAPTGRSIDYTNPRVGARLADGSRIMAHVPPVAVRGTTFSIRRFTQGLTPALLVEKGMFSREIMDFIQACVEGALNIIVTGGTSSGKTTVLNAIFSFVPEEESIITIEDRRK